MASKSALVETRKGSLAVPVPVLAYVDSVLLNALEIAIMPINKTAINAILLQSSRTDSDYYLHDHAEKINKIAKNSKNASTRAYAINALAKILSRTTSNYYASKISEYIEELA